MVTLVGAVACDAPTPTVSSAARTAETNGTRQRTGEL
jgi:hypothetical protein